MSKVTYEKLDEFGPVVKSTFRMLYPNGLTVEQLAEKAQSFNWLRMIYERFKGGANDGQ